MYSVCSLISSLVPLLFIAFLGSVKNLFTKSLYSFNDSVKRIYHDRCKNIYINYNNKRVAIYQLGLFTTKHIDSFVFDEQTVKDDIDTSIKDYFKKVNTINTFDDWDGAIGGKMRRDKRLDDILN